MECIFKDLTMKSKNDLLSACSFTLIVKINSYFPDYKQELGENRMK